MARQLGSAYMLDDLVGRGATGEVWSGRHLPDDGPVAVKVLRPEFTDDPELVARFVQERSLLIGLDSPHLVRVRDLVVEGNTLAIVMDLVPGKDLRHLMREQRLAPELAIDLAVQVLDGLSVVHRAGIVHRDLKPENILVDRTDPAHPRASITDFGVARLANGPSLTKITGLIGTPIYMAPELSERGAPTAAVDLYSAGIVLYEMLTGRPPFDASHPMAVLRAHLEERPAPIPGLPNAVGVVLASLLEKDPADRPADAAVARARLESARSSVANLAPLVADDAGAPADPYATTLPDLGETRVGGRRSNPPRDTPRSTDATTPLPVAVPTAPDSGGRKRSRRTLVAAAAVVVVLLGTGVAFAARGGGGGSPKVASPPTTRPAAKTTITVHKRAKTKKPPTPTTRPETVTTAPVTGTQSGGSHTSGGSAGSGGSNTNPPATSAATTPATTPVTAPPHTAPPTTAPHPTPTVVINGPIQVCEGATVGYTASITNATSWYWKDVLGHVQNGGTSITLDWNLSPGTYKFELKATNAYRYYDDYKTVKVVSC